MAGTDEVAVAGEAGGAGESPGSGEPRRPSDDDIGPGARAGWRRHLPAVALVVLLLGSVTVALATSQSKSPSFERQALAIEHDIRCPSCEALSVATSSAPTAVTLRRVILARLRSGQSAREIEDYVVSRYGEGILLRPPSTGLAGLVWWLPALAALAALVALAGFFWRRRGVDLARPSDDDRELVRRAREERSGSAP